MKGLLGGKGANLAEMTRIGLPVPPGFTISTEVCTYFYAHHRSYPAAMRSQVEEGIRRMERIMGTNFGDTKAMPLLVAVRSGARDSMPGMMDTILNLGLNDKTVVAVAEADKKRAFRLGLLSPLYPNVWRRGHGRAKTSRRRSRAVRDGDPRAQTRAPSRGYRRYQTERGRLERVGRAFQKAGEGADRQAISQRSLGTTLRMRSAPCSVRG